MKLVVDTNILVSGLLNGEGSPGKLVDAILAGELIAVCSVDIMAEYREVLNRQTFPFNPEDVQALIETIDEGGSWIDPEPSQLPLPDETDRAFIDAARFAACPIVTGNRRHFPAEAGVEILSAAEVLKRLFTA